MTEPAAPPRTEPVLDSVTRADQSDELATTTLLRAAIGTVNTNYYLSIFTRFDAQDRVGPSWNTAAGLATLNWMMFRRMWNAALAYSGIALTVALLVFGIGKLAFHFSSEVQWGLAGLYALALVALPGFFGNALLFRQYRNDMARALSAHHTISEAAVMLQARAPTRQRLMGLGVFNALGIAALVALSVWASSFNGLSSAFNPTAVVPAPMASGNVASGRAIDAKPATAPTPATSAAAVQQASVSAAQATASSPAVTASAPAKSTSAPVAAASAPVTTPTNGGRGLVQPPAAVSPMPKDTASAPSTKEKVEAARLAPLSNAQNREATKVPTPSGGKAAPTEVPRKSTPPAAAVPRASAPVERPRNKATAPTPAPEFDGKPGVPAGSYGINVGLFANENNARNAFIKLSDAGLPAYSEQMRGKKGPLTRVRVGPFDSDAQAQKTAERIRALGLDAEVFKQPLKP